MLSQKTAMLPVRGAKGQNTALTWRRTGRPDVVIRATARPSAEHGDGAMVDRRAMAAMLGVGLGFVLQPSTAYARAAAAPAINSVKVVETIIGEETAGDVDKVVASQAKTVVWKLPSAYPGDPLGGEFKGRYGVLTYLNRQQKYVKDMKIRDLKVSQGDGKDQVVARFRMSGKLADGGKFSTSVTQVWKVESDGSIGSMKAYYDTASLAKAAGKAVA